MLHFVRRSLLVQLLSVYLLFVIVVLIGGVGVNFVVEQQLQKDVQASDQALAQEIAQETDFQMSDAENALGSLGELASAQSGNTVAIENEFRVFQAARSNVDHVYWLDTLGGVTVSWPRISELAEFSPPEVVQNIHNTLLPVFEVGFVGIEPTTAKNPGVIIAEPVFDAHHHLMNIIAASISLYDLSTPLKTVVTAQQKQQRRLMISIIDAQGVLVASPQKDLILQTVVDQLPGAAEALHGQIASSVGPGTDGQNWLFSAVPVPTVGWAVVVQRPVAEALAVVGQFQFWLLMTALLFAFGGLLFWLLLLQRVIRPLHTLSIQHQVLPTSAQAIPVHTRLLATRNDEVGNLVRSLVRLEHDGLSKLGELRTLLETSNAVVGSLEPRAVVGKIIQEVRRLVDVQAAAVLLSDEQGVLRVLVSAGHSEYYDHMLSLSSENEQSSAVLALRDGKPVQKLLVPDQQPSPSLSYAEGFRSVLAIPILSRHTGGVVLLVHRSRPLPFNQHEIDLLLTFANYATLAWEHAVLYERSDVRLREIAQENQQLYQQASEEQQKLAAIMDSMSDGLILTSTNGTILYANGGASTIAGIPGASLERHSIHVLYDAFRAMAVDPIACERVLSQAESAEAKECVVELKHFDVRRVIHVRLFAVENALRQIIGRGLLLRDVTRERELDEFKSALLAAVGHELRTPLAAIKGYASTLLQKDVSWSPADQQHFLSTISTEADRLAQLVSNLLDLSRQEAGLLLLNRTPTSVRELVNKSTRQIDPQHAHIIIDISPDIPLVNVDSARIEVVLHNLMRNAVIYGNGKVRISAEKQQHRVIVGISDNGPGIAPAELPHVFERFYRAHYGREQHSGGTGLGLTICKAFIEAHGGTIWAESDSEAAHGTTFYFSLPIVSSAITIVLPDAGREATELPNEGGLYDSASQTHSTR